MVETWDGSENRVFEDGSLGDVGSTYIRLNGSNVPVEPGSSFVDVVKTSAKDAGLGKFRVFLNETEVKPSEVPSLVDEGSKIELRPYDVAGI